MLIPLANQFSNNLSQFNNIYQLKKRAKINYLINNF